MSPIILGIPGYSRLLQNLKWSGFCSATRLFSKISLDKPLPSPSFAGRCTRHRERGKRETETHTHVDKEGDRKGKRKVEGKNKREFYTTDKFDIEV